MAWKDISIRQYREISKLEKNDDWQWNALAIVNNTTYEDIINRPINETMALSREFNQWALDAPIVHPVKRKYVINGHKYDFKGYPENLSTAAYIDFYNMDKTVPDNLAGHLSLVLIPEGHRYNEGYDINEVREEIDNYLDVEEAYSICDFFTSLFQLLQVRAIRKAKKALKQAKKEGIAPEEVAKAEKYLRTVGLKWFRT